MYLRRFFFTILPATLALSLFTVFLLTGIDKIQARSLRQSGPPTLVNYQGRLTDVSSSPLEGTVSIDFALYDAETAGNQLWTETQSVSLAEDGSFAVLLGSVTPLDSGLFDGRERWLQLTVDDGEPFPRQRLASVPFALQADRARNASRAVSASHATTATTAASAEAVPWGGIRSRPNGLDDGDDDTLSALSCANGEVAKWDGSNWACVRDRDTDTTYSAGNGIVLNDTVFSLDTSTVYSETEIDSLLAAKADAGHTHDDRYYVESELQTDGQADVHWGNVSNKPAGFADNLDNDTTYSAGTGLALNGSQFRVTTLPMPGFTNTTVDSAGNVGMYSSMIVGVDGLPLISYYNAGSGHLKVRHCHDLVCSTGTSTTLDSSGIVGKYTSITIGRAGFGLISYYDDTNGALKLARCDNIQCTSADLTTVDDDGDVGQYTSITTNDDGYAFISYYDVSSGNLKAVSCNDLSCSSKNTWTVDEAGDVGQYSSVTRNGRDYGYISYYDATNGNLKVARCAGMNCNNLVINTVDGTESSGGAEDDVGRFSAITTGVDGFPLIAYAKAAQPGFSSSQLRVAHCTSAACSSADVDTVISASAIDWQGISITLGQDGYGLFTSTFSTTSRIYTIHCSNVACTDQTIADNTVTSGAVDSSVTIGADGLPIISYFSDVSDDLHFVHCSDATCQPYLRRR